jgi:hypothetical protein
LFLSVIAHPPRVLTDDGLPVSFDSPQSNRRALVFEVANYD